MNQAISQIDVPSDWHHDSIRRLEEALRCSICGEFMKNAS
jgi:hypothetical protein